MRKVIILLSAIALTLGLTATAASADHSRAHRIEQAEAALAAANTAHAAAVQALADAEAAVPAAQTAADEAAAGVARTDAQFQIDLNGYRHGYNVILSGCSRTPSCYQQADWFYGWDIDRVTAILAVPREEREAAHTAAQAALTQAKADLAEAETALAAAAVAVTAAEAALAEAQAAAPLPREKDVVDSAGFAVEGKPVPPTFAPVATIDVADCTDEGIAFTVTTDNTGSTDGTNAGAGTVGFTTTIGTESTTADVAAGEETTSGSAVVAFDEVVAISVEATVDGQVSTLAERTIDPSNDCDSAVGITVAGPNELLVGESGVYTVNVTNTRGNHLNLVQVGLEVEAGEGDLDSDDVTLETCDTAACESATPVEFELTDGVLHVTQDGLAAAHGADVDRFLRLTFANTGAYVGTVYAIDSGVAA